MQNKITKRILLGGSRHIIFGASPGSGDCTPPHPVLAPPRRPPVSSRPEWVCFPKSPLGLGEQVSGLHSSWESGRPGAHPAAARVPGPAADGGAPRRRPANQRPRGGICALRLRARHAPRPHPGHLHKARDGPCEFAPVVVTPPQSVHNVTGAQVYLSCEVRAVPTPVITWRKVTQSPEGTQVLEDLPGDHINIAVQVRGGPSDHEATAWILINPLRKEDEGVYLCHSANAVGEAQSHGTVTVLDLSKFTAPHLPAPEDRM
uniref:Insulin like growth factor binding protein like 1 n=1 Tax=Ailuropoda melanoleuca TaxID=9646 RepID=A0A7N5JFX9_AILME